MIDKLRTSWRSYREKRRQYQIERALFKSRASGGFRNRDGTAVKSLDDLSDITPGSGPS